MPKKLSTTPNTKTSTKTGTKTTKPAAPVAEAPKPVKSSPRVASARHRTVKPKVVASSATSIAVVENSREAIAKIAYGYWEARGRQAGDPLTDWLRAEAEYTTRKAAL